MTVNGYLFAGYAVLWTAIFLYLVFLHRRQQRLNRELKSLAESFQESKTGSSH